MHASDAINVSARVSDRPGMLSPYQKLYGRAPFPRLLPFLKPGFYHVKRTLKSEPKAQVCFFLNSGNTHPSDCCKVFCVCPAAGRTPAMLLGSIRGKPWPGCFLRHGSTTPHHLGRGCQRRRCPRKTGRYGMSWHRCRQGRHQGRHNRHQSRQGRHR